MIIDCFTKFVKLYPVKTLESEEVINCLLDWFATFGVARTIVSDNGSAFISKLTEKMTNMFKIKRILTASHSHWETGLVESINKRIKLAFQTSLSDPAKWDTILSMVEMSLRSTPNQATGTSPHEILFGYRHQNEVDWELSKKVLEDEGTDNRLKGIATGLQFLRTAVKENIESSRTTARKYYNNGRVERKDFPIGSLVLLENFRKHKNLPEKFQPAFIGPFLVWKKIGHALYKLKDAVTNKTIKYLAHQDHLKLYNVPATKEYLQEQLNETMMQTDIQSDRRIQRPTGVPNVQDQWKEVVKILGRQGKNYRVEMRDGTENIVRPEMVPPVLKSEYNQQIAGRTRPILPRRAKQAMRNLEYN